MTKTGTAAQPPLEFEDRAESAMEWVRSNARYLAYGLVVVAAVGIGLVLWRAAGVKKEANASRALAEAQATMAAGNLPLAASDLQKMVQRYGDTMSGQEGRLLLAQIFFQQGKPQDGLKLLDEADADGPLAVSVHAIRAAGLEQSGKPAEAAAEYLKAADVSTTDTEKATLRGDAARAFLAAGRPDEALKIWQPMAEDESNPINAEAKLRVGELSVLPKKG